MYRETQEKRSSRWRSRERRAIGDPDLVSMERAQRGGNDQLRKQTNLSTKALDFTPGNRVPVEENSFDLEFRRPTSKKASTTPIKELLDKETSKEMKVRRSSPSVVARLMGLDTLPPVVTRQKKERGISSQNTSSVGFHGKHTSYEGYPLLTSSNEYQECKDVFEVREMPKVEKQNNKPFRKGISSLGQSEIDLKPSDIDLAFAKQKFVDAAHLSTDDEFQYSKEYNDASEDLDTNENLFVKFLQEPNSLFKKHLQDLKYSPPSPHVSHITILKPSRVVKSDNELCCRSKRNTERHSHLLKGDISSCRKPVSNLVNHSAKEHSCSLPHKLSEPLYEGKTKGHLQSAQIVVLKPSLEKAWDTVKTVPSARSPDNYPYGLRSQKRIPMSRRSEVYGGGRERHKLSGSVGVTGHKTKELREIARAITKQLRSAGSSGSKMVTDSKKHRYIRDESSRAMSGMENLKSESHRLIFDQLNDCSDSLSSSSYYSTESLVSKEARKRLSERWKSIQQIQEVGPGNKGSSTLGEMLVFDKDISRTTLIAPIIQNVSGEKVARDEILARWDSPLGISGKDGWEDEWSRNLSSSKSLPASSLVYGNHKPSKRNKVGVSDSSYLQNVPNMNPNDSVDRNVSQRKSSIQSLNYRHTTHQFYSGREESEISEREIHVNSEQLHDRIHVRHPGEEVCMVLELSNNSISGRGHEDGNLALQCEDAKFPVVVDDEQVQRSTRLEARANDGEFSGADPNYVARKETSVDLPQVSSLSSHCDISESPSPVSSKEDQPSPVSVLELPPSEDDRSSSECFEKISADLKELRMQLKLLKLESADTDDEDFELLISSDEDIGECHSPLNSGDILAAFRDDEDRDFSYLLDVLIDSGVHCSSSNGLLNACYTQEYRVGREVFEKLEKKYSVLVSWSKSERKLLLDLISSILAENFTPSIHPQSMKSRFQHTHARDVLVEEVWQLVVKERKELSSGKLEEKLLLEPRWLDVRDDVDMIGRELERMLIDELMDELLSQLM